MGNRNKRKKEETPVELKTEEGPPVVEVAPEVVEEGPIAVIANEPGYYGDIYRVEGAKFSVKNSTEVGKWMDRADGKSKAKVKEEPDPNVKILKQPETIKDATGQV